MPLSRPRTALVRAAALLSLVACTGGGEGTTGPGAPTLTLSATSAAPATIVSGQLSGRTLPAGTVTATFNALVVRVTRLDDSSFAFAVPVVAPGAYPLVVTHLNGTLTGTLQVTAAPVIANPGAYVTSAIDIGEDALDALELELNAGVDDLAVDSTLRREDIARIRVLIADARSKAAVASPTERAQAAAYLAANAGALGITVSGGAFREKSGIVSTMQAELGAGACVDEDGVELSDAEECSAQLTTFGNNAVKRLLVLAASTAIAYVEGATFVGAVAAVVTAILVYKELARIQDETMRRFIAPVIAKLSIFGDEELREASGALRAAGTSAALVEPEYFVTATTRGFRVRGAYRSLQTTDVSIAGLAPMVGVARVIERITNGIRAAFLQRAIRPLVPATPRNVVTREIPQRYLRLAGVTPGSITGLAAVSDTSWMLRFTRSGITGDVPFTFDVIYAAPGQAVQEQTVSSVLIPTARFIARSLSSGFNGDGMCAEDANGTSYCWGRNQYGRLGDLTTTMRPRPTRLLTGTGLRGLSMGEHHACGLRATGLAECWGVSYAIGNVEARRTSTDRNTAGPVEGGFAYSMIDAGATSTCGLTASGARCWGPSFFAPPAGTTVAPAVGEAVLMPGSSGFSTITVGRSSWACGLTTAGSIRCVGQNNYAQLGDGTRTDRNSLVTLAGGLTWSAVAAGALHACALTTAGRAYCWGANGFGQIGDAFASSGTGSTLTPVPVSGNLVFTQIFAGDTHSCALTAAGKAYCWGTDRNSSLQLSNVPAPVNTPVSFKTLSTGRDLTCGIAVTGGGVFCWGDNSSGAVGIGAATFNEPVRTVVPPLP